MRPNVNLSLRERSAVGCMDAEHNAPPLAKIVPGILSPQNRRVHEAKCTSPAQRPMCRPAAARAGALRLRLHAPYIFPKRPANRIDHERPRCEFGDLRRLRAAVSAPEPRVLSARHAALAYFRAAIPANDGRRS